MSWSLAYLQICNQFPNPTRIEFEVRSSPIIVAATPIGQLNGYYKLGRLSFLTELSGLGVVKGKSQPIHRGCQFLDTIQLADYAFKSEFWVYGYVPQVRLDFYVSDVNVQPDSREFLELNATLTRLEEKIDTNTGM